MIVYPTMELHGGRVVTLDKGQLDAPMIWHVDPVETARSWAAAGASCMNLTDFDAVQGNNANSELVTDIIRAAGIPVQLGGGFRSRESVERWIDKGAGRIVIGTLAAQDPQTVKELAKYHPDQIILAVDVYQGKVMMDGWRQSSAYEPEAFIDAFSDSPLAGIILTDVESDIGDVDAQLGVISGLAMAAKCPVIASGIVRSLDDIARLKYIPSIAGVAVGRALFRKTVDLSEALELAQSQPEPVAEFL